MASTFTLQRRELERAQAIITRGGPGFYARLLRATGATTFTGIPAAAIYDLIRRFD